MAEEHAVELNLQRQLTKSARLLIADLGGGDRGRAAKSAGGRR